MKSAWQCGQRQGSACFRKQTANTSRWIFHFCSVLMRGNRRMPPWDFIVILETFHLQKLDRGKPPMIWRRHLDCPSHPWVVIPLCGYLENSSPASALDLRYERMSEMISLVRVPASFPNLVFWLMPGTPNAFLNHCVFHGTYWEIKTSTRQLWIKVTWHLLFVSNNRCNTKDIYKYSIYLRIPLLCTVKFMPSLIFFSHKSGTPKTGSLCKTEQTIESLIPPFSPQEMVNILKLLKITMICNLQCWGNWQNPLQKILAILMNMNWFEMFQEVT